MCPKVGGFAYKDMSAGSTIAPRERACIVLKQGPRNLRSIFGFMLHFLEIVPCSSSPPSIDDLERCAGSKLTGLCFGNGVEVCARYFLLVQFVSSCFRRDLFALVSGNSFAKRYHGLPLCAAPMRALFVNVGR